MSVSRGTWTLVVGDWMMLVVRGRLVGAVGSRPLLVVRCWWLLVVGGRLLIVWGKLGCREMALLPQISQGLISTSLSLWCLCTALKALNCTTKNSGNGLNKLSLSACSCCCLKRASTKDVSSPILEVGLADERVQTCCCLDVVEPSSWDSFGEDLSLSASELTELEISADSVKFQRKNFMLTLANKALFPSQ